ncbi:MAG: MarR family transcriptional regulator [Lachnospiraceae bacterium]|nr:MarR family transcriptional regulator [Lachnospiraceae bacterium]
MFKKYEELDITNRLICNFRDIGHVIRGTSEGKGSQKRVLIILLESGPVTQTALTEHLDIQPGSASEVLGRLEKLGFIQRTANEADKRTVLISLTKTGILEAQEALRQRKNRHSEMFSALSDEEQRELLGLLEKLCDDWVIRYAEHMQRRKRRL